MATQPDPSRGALAYDAPGKPGQVVYDESLMNLSLKPALARYLMHLPAGHLGRPDSRWYFDFLDLSPRTAGLAVKIVTALLLLGAAWLFRTPIARHSDPALLWELAAVSILMLLISPITWKQHCVALLPPAYLIGRTLLHKKGTSLISPPPAPIQKTTSIFLGLDAALLAAYILLAILLQRGVIGRSATDLMDSYHLRTAALLLLLVLTLRGWRGRLFRVNADPISEAARSPAPTP